MNYLLPTTTDFHRYVTSFACAPTISLYCYKSARRAHVYTYKLNSVRAIYLMAPVEYQNSAPAECRTGPADWQPAPTLDAQDAPTHRDWPHADMSLLPVTARRTVGGQCVTPSARLANEYFTCACPVCHISIDAIGP